MSRQTEKADKIIHNYVVASGAAGFFIPIAGADMFAIGGIQMKMLKDLCDLFDEPFEDMTSQAFMCTVSGAVTARLGATVIKAIPGIGTAIGGLSMAFTGGASTYALGQTFVRYLDDVDIRNELDDGKIMSIFDYFKKYFLAIFKRVSRAEYAVDMLIDLADLKEKNLVNDEFIEGQKAKLFKDIKPVTLPNDKTIKILKKISEFKEFGLLTDEEFELLKGAFTPK